MYKNVASQKLIVFAFDSTTNLPKTGDAANITAYVSKDYGAVTVLGDTSATEMDSTNAKGYYLFDLTQAETNADTLLFSAKSTTSNIVVIGAPATVFTLPGSNSGISANVTLINSVSTSSVTTVNANIGTTQPTNFTGTGGSALVKADTVDIAGSAVSTSSAQIGVNVVQVNAVSTSSVTTINANQGTTQPVNFTGTAGSALVKSDTVDIAGSAVSTSSAQIGVNVVQVNAVSTSSVTTINANQGTTQPLNFTGTAASALVKSDMTDIAGAAVSTTTAQIGVNAVQINAVSTSSVTAVNANVGTTQPVNFTGTAGAALVKSDTVDIAGAAVSTSTAQVGVNLVSTSSGSINRAAFTADSGLQNIRANTAAGGGSTSITLDGGASAVTNFYDNCLVYLTGGTGVGQARFITAYNGSTKVATVTAWGTNPDNTTTFAILPFDAIPGATAPTAAQNATAVWTDLLAGSDFSTVGSVGALVKANTVNVTQWNSANVATPNIGGVPIVDVGDWLGTAVTAATAGKPDVNAARINNVATTSVTTVNANVGTTQPLNFTGTAGSALVKADMQDIAGAAVSTSTAQIGVNVVQYNAQTAQTDANNLPKVDTEDIAGAAVSATTAQLGVNVVSWRSGTPNALVSGNVTAQVASYASGQDPAIRKNQALNNFEFYMVQSADHVTPATGLTVTAQRSLDGGALANCANAVTELSNGLYVINLAASDLNGNVVTLRFTATGADATVLTIFTQP